MSFNLNAGFGQVVGQLPFLGSGKHFIVGDSSTANIDVIKQLFGYDPDGTLRYFDDVDSAIGECTANAGDRILAMPGHTETITAASGIDMDVAGVSLIGLGLGSDRPTITFTTVDSADMDFGADNLLIKNIVFVCGVDGLDEPLDIEASVDNVTFEDCEFRDDTASMQTDRWIQTAATNTNLKLINCEHVGSDTAGAVAFITITGGSGHVIKNLVSNGNFSAGNIQLLTTLTNDILIDGCILENANAVDVNIEGNSLSSTGWIRNTMCRLATDGQTTWINNVGLITIYESFGADNSGEAGQRIGTANSGSIEDDVNEILTDTGTTIPALHTVPTADVTTNTNMRDVVGNKTDAAAAGAVSATESLMAYAKQVVTELQVVDEYHDVPSADATANAQMNEVIGNKTDGIITDSTNASAMSTNSVLAMAKSVLRRIGANSADNETSTSSVVADADGSVFERLEYLQVDNLALPRCVEKSDGAVLTGNDDLFTISGGPIKILSLVGIVTTIIGGASNGDVQLVTTSPAATVDLNAAPVAIDSDAAGTSYTMINTTGVFTPTTAGFVLFANSFATNETEYLAPEGTIHFRSSAAQTGVIKWYLRYIPLSPNSRVVAAA